MSKQKEIIMKQILKEIDDLTRISVDIELMNDDECALAKRGIVDRIAAIKDKTETLGTYSELYLRS